MSQARQKIILLSHQNQYQSKWHFCEGLRKALEKIGMDTKHFALTGGDFSYEQMQELQRDPPDAFCSFNEVSPVKGRYFFDHMQTPMVHLLVDHVLYFTDLAKSPYSYFSATDQKDCKLMNQLSGDRCFFFPHAIDSAWKGQSVEKKYEVVFFGSSIDPLAIENLWKSYGKKVWKALMSAKEMLLQTSYLSTLEALQQHLLSPDEMPRGLVDHIRELEWAVRGYHRNEVLKALSDFDVHIFGENNVLFAGRSWGELVPKACHHGALGYADVLAQMQKAKLVVNSSPFFPHGSHERIFMGMQAKSLVLTNPSTYVESSFKDEIVYYDYQNLEKLSDQVAALFADNSKVEQITTKAHQKVLQEHSWENRAPLLVDFLGKSVQKA